MLRRIRLIVALVFFILITLLFLDFTGTLHGWFGWLAKIQFLPAVLALNVGVILLWVVLTLVFGRVYCSVICPLGVFQDVVSWFSGRRKKKKYRFSYSPAVSWLRYGMLGVFIIAMIAGIGSVVALLAPYSSYGRIVSNLFAPVYQWGNNVLAYFAERSDSYAFYETSVWLKSLPTFIIAAGTFVVLVVLAWRNGRTYCNTICPVGTVLGFFSRYSLFRPEIDAEKCTNCSLCSRKCKAACINYKDHRIDYSRCVTCMDCIDSCKHGAISYKYRFGKKEIKETSETGNTNNARRSFLTGMGLVLVSSAVKAQEKKVDGGLAVILDKKVPARMTPLVPPGAKGLRNMRTHCTGCQLCVSVCPNRTKCSEVCPAGAILKLTPADKSATQIGHAVWVEKNCVPLRDKVACGNCARHCPTGAITMVPSDADDADSLKIPVVNVERCIGCGACENLCPARPFSAIYVEGHEQHRTI